MRLQFEPPSTYFVHVPKTGGITLGSLLDLCFRRRESVQLNPPRMARISPEELKSFRCYHAMHQGRTLLELTGRSDLTCLTMLRDPIERSVSQIRYLQRVVKDIPHTFTQEYLEEVAPLLNADLTKVLHVQAFEAACDAQIRTLGIREDYRPLFKGSIDAESGRSVLRPYPLPPLMDVSDRDALLANGVSWLSEMAVVGLTERYPESVLMVCDVLGIPAPSSIPRKNANPSRNEGQSNYRKTLDSKVLGQLQELTRHDQLLYDHARELFEEQWSRYLRQPKKTYSISAHARYSVKSPARRVLEFIRPGRRP